MSMGQLLRTQSGSLIILFLVWALIIKVAQGTVQHLIARPQHHDEHDKNGAVASENKICSQIGIDLLKVGGNAADAMVGTAFCVGTIHLYHSGPGGGGFMLVRLPNGSYESIDFRESAPAAAHENMFKDNTQGAVTGGLASGIPGELRGLEQLHRYGELPWSEVIQPSILLAREGFVIGHDMFDKMAISTKEHDFLTEDPAWAVDFAPNGTRVGLGDTMTRMRYAKTLEVIAYKGSDAFYNGEMAEKTIDAIRQYNGTMAVEDLRDYKAISRPAIEIEYRGSRIIACPAPASGAVVLSVLKILEGYEDIDSEGKLDLSTHRMNEAMRFGYGKRASLGDPDYVAERPIVDLEAEMIDEKHARDTRKRINDTATQSISYYDPSGFEIQESHGTAHIVTSDASGLTVTLTSTINLFFGSKVMVPETGVILNNEMDDFSIPNTNNTFGYRPSPSNYIRPDKRPLSSCSPIIIEFASGALAAFGAAGGSRIITATLQTAIDVLDRNMTLLQALKEPRMHDQLVPNTAFFEWDGFDNGTVEFMRQRGHDVRWSPRFSSVQAVVRQSNGTFVAASEPNQRDSAGYAV